MNKPGDSSREDFYRESMRILEDAEIPYLVGGAFCLGHYTGIIRDTKDFDLMMRRSDVDRALQTFRSAGCRAEIVYSHWLAKVHHGESFIDIIFNSGNGLCVVDDAWFENARRGEILGREVNLCPPEEVIWQKAYIMERERFDGGDVIHMLRSCGAMLDWPRLIERFGPDWRALFSHLVLFGFVYPSRRSLIPSGIMEVFLEKLALETRDADGGGRLCNGTFLSRAQYLPDIERWGFEDPRAGNMTEQEIEIWTNAIEKSAFHG